jgi:predicted DsbA family dithiol-disulfide isomerase
LITIFHILQDCRDMWANTVLRLDQMEGNGMSKNVVEIDVVSDVMCPWCYVGKKRLQKALEMVADDIEVKINWRPFQLDPTIPPEGRDRKKYLSDKFGTDEQIAEKYQPIADAGKVEGIPFNFEAIKVSPNTLDAHRLIHWSRTVGLQNDMSERLFTAYFVDAMDLTDAGVLADLAEEVGMERDIVERLLSGDADKKQVAEEMAHYQQMGVRSVPTMIVGKKYAVVGAQEAGTIAEVIEGVHRERGQA